MIQGQRKKGYIEEIFLLSKTSISNFIREEELTV